MGDPELERGTAAQAGLAVRLGTGRAAPVDRDPARLQLQVAGQEQAQQGPRQAQAPPVRVPAVTVDLGPLGRGQQLLEAAPVGGERRRPRDPEVTDPGGGDHGSSARASRWRWATGAAWACPEAAT